MGFASFSLAGGILAILLSFAIVLRTRTYLRLRHIPGPPLASVSEFWLLWKTLGGRLHLDTAEACKKYGSLIRVSPNVILTDDPDILRRLSAVRSPYIRSNWYDGMRFEADNGHVFSERNEARHLELRSKMAAGYSGKENDHLEDSVDLNIARFVTLLGSKYLSTNTTYRPVDFAPKSTFFTLDVISEVAFGKCFGNLEADKDVHEYIKGTESLFPILVLLGAFPWMAHAFNSWPLKTQLPKPTDSVGTGKLMGLAKEIVGERVGPNKKVRRDMLGSWLQHGLSPREAQSEMLLQIIAGSDSSATAIRATLLYIVTNPRVQSKLLEEISTSPISSPITDAEARNMPYLQSVIKEGLRIMPPIPGLMLKEVPTGGDTLNGVFVPGGTLIGWSGFGLMRNEKLWGTDANLFRPERWLEGTPEEIKAKEQNVDLVFGYGRYQCLGKNVVNMELNKVFVELLRRFEFTIVDPAIPWKSFMAGFFLQSDMWMTVADREPKL